MSTKSQELFERVYEIGASSDLPLTRYILITEGTLIFEAIKLISCAIQRNCISSFEDVHVIHVFMREYSIDIFAKNDFDPRVT